MMNLPMHLKQHPNGVWYIHFTRTHKKSLGTRQEKEARRFYRELSRAYLQRKITAITGGPPKKSLVDFWEEYAEHRLQTARPFSCQTDKQAFRVFRRALGDDTPLTQISRRQLEKALGDLAQRVSRTSANTWFRHFKAALNLAQDWGYLTKNPADGIKPLRVQAAFPRWLTEAEFARLLEAETDPRFALFWRFQVYSGARRSESLSITAKNINWPQNRIDLGHTKNNRPRFILLTPRIREVLQELKPPEVGRLWPWQPDTVSHHFARTCKKAGLACRLHDLRHTYGSWLVMRGVPLYTVGKLLGHQDPKTTQIYAHLSQDHLEEAAGKL